MVGREQSRQTRKFACFGITRRKRDGWAGSNAGKLASLLALLWRGARRYGWVGSKASKLASLPAFVERDARRSGWVGIKACLACLLASLLACLLQGRFSAPRQLPGFRSLLSGYIYIYTKTRQTHEPECIPRKISQRFLLSTWVNNKNQRLLATIYVGYSPR